MIRAIKKWFCTLFCCRLGIIMDEKPVHFWFSLSYASFLTVPRVVMEGMPLEWQQKMVKLLEEMDDEYEWLPKDSTYWVSLRDKKGRFTKLPESLCNYRRPRIDHLKKSK